MIYFIFVKKHLSVTYRSPRCMELGWCKWNKRLSIFTPEAMQKTCKGPKRNDASGDISSDPEQREGRLLLIYIFLNEKINKNPPTVFFVEELTRARVFSTTQNTGSNSRERRGFSCTFFEGNGIKKCPPYCSGGALCSLDKTSFRDADVLPAHRDETPRRT